MKKLFSLIVFLVAGNIIYGKIIKVPQDYENIQSAINASNNLDTVLVSEGTYFENVKFNGKNIVLASNFIFTRNIETIKKTIIDGSKSANPDSASCISFNKRENSDAVLEGFTITGGSGTKYTFSFGPFQEGGGIILGYSSAIIRNNIIRDNNVVAAPGAQRGGGGGIASMYGNPVISNNVIYNNDAGYAGGIVLNWSSGKIINNIIYHNFGGVSYGTGGIMIWEPTTNVSVENNTIIGNISFKDAGGMNINSNISIVKNNIIWANRQPYGPQVVNADRGRRNNIEDFSDANNISVEPVFLDNSFLLADNSPCIDAGDAAESYNDNVDPQDTVKALFPSRGSLRNDLGAFGGKLASILPSLDVSDIYVSKSSITGLVTNVGKELNQWLEILNIGTDCAVIDSVSHVNSNDFVFEYKNKTLNVFHSDTLKFIFRPTVQGNIKDTIKIYHQVKDKTNPIIIPVKAKGNAPTSIETDNPVGYKFELFQNYPNPFNPGTVISYQLSVSSSVSLKIYDILGNEVATLINEDKPAGEYKLDFDGSKLPSGIYFYQLLAGNSVDTKKMILLK